MNRNERGQSVVEFMLVLPFALLVIMAMAEFGAAFYTYITVNNATSEAARWAATGNDHVPSDACAAESIQWRAQQMSRGLLNCDTDTAFTIAYEDAASGAPGRGTGVTVTVTHTYSGRTPLPGLINLVSGGLFPESWEMRSCSDARLERRVITGTYVASTGHCGSSS